MFEQDQEISNALAGVRRLTVAIAVVAAVSASAAHAADAGMTVVKDPETGLLRAPTAEEFKALQGAAPAKAVRGPQAIKAAPAEVRMPDGSAKVVLDDSHMSYSVVTRKADGSLAEYCVTGADAANKVVSGKQGSASKIAKTTKEHNHDVQ